MLCGCTGYNKRSVSVEKHFTPQAPFLGGITVYVIYKLIWNYFTFHCITADYHKYLINTNQQYVIIYWELFLKYTLLFKGFVAVWLLKKEKKRN